MNRPAEQTVFSLSDEVPEPLDFAAHGAGLGGAVGADETVLARGAVGELCSVRKLSRRGAVLHTDTPVAVGQHLSFELMNGRAISGTVSWVRGSEVILRFGGDLDVLGVIAAELVSQPGERRRMPRVELALPIRLQIGPRILPVTTVDLSQGGVKVALGDPLRDAGVEALVVDTALDVALPAFRSLQSRVRWCEAGMAGLLFDHELSWQELMPWLRARSAPVAATRTLVPGLAPAVETSPAPSVELNIPARIREGASRWDVEVLAITTTNVEFTSYTKPRLGMLISIALPGLPSWSGRVSHIDGDRWTCEFAQALHPAVLERMLTGRA